MSVYIPKIYNYGSNVKVAVDDVPILQRCERPEKLTFSDWFIRFVSLFICMCEILFNKKSHRQAIIFFKLFCIIEVRNFLKTD